MTSSISKPRVLIITPDEIRLKDVDDLSLETLQGIVGGNIEHVYGVSSWSLYCNEEGKYTHANQKNIAFLSEDDDILDIIVGPVVIVGYQGDGEEISLSDGALCDFRKLFTEKEEVSTFYFFNGDETGVKLHEFKLPKQEDNNHV